jgi:prevent-host-death family protein
MTKKKKTQTPPTDATDSTDSTGDRSTDRPQVQRSIAETRDDLAGLVHDAEQGNSVEITRRGKPVAVLLAYGEYQRLLGDGPSFWDALMTFRSAAENDPEDLGIERQTFPRHKSPGRSVDLS